MASSTSSSHQKRAARVQEIIRRLASLPEGERDVVAGGLSPARLARLGRRSGLSTEELQRVLGLSRSSVFALLRSKERRSAVDALEVLLFLSGGRAATREELASSLDVAEETLYPILVELEARELVIVLSGGYDGPETQVPLIGAGPRAHELLDALHADLGRRGSPDRWLVYVALSASDRKERARLVDAAKKVCGDEGVGEIREADAPSAMRSDELGFAVAAPTQRAAFETVHDLWRVICERAGLSPTPAPITAFSPPAGLAEGV
jgi:hypothetical protein